MGKTGIGRELGNESIACRPCSLNFVDKSLRQSSNPGICEV